MQSSTVLNSSPLMIFTGNANPALAAEVASYLDTKVGNANVGRFSDGEVCVEIEQNVRGRDVFIIQPTCRPTNDTLVELLVMIDAMRWASARRITAVIPYFGYARQDRRIRSQRVPITARLMAKMIGQAGADRVLTIDLHADQIQGFFDIPVDNIYASPILIGEIWRQRYENLVVVSPDHGGVVRARAIAKRLEADLAFIDKRRPRPNVLEVMNLVGEVKDRSCVLVDDMADTAGTLCKAAEAIKEKGAKSVSAFCTHPILSGNAVQNIADSVLDELVVTNTIPLTEEARKCAKIRQVSIGELLAETIRRISNEESVSSLFVD